MERIVIWLLIGVGALSLLMGIFPDVHGAPEHAPALRTIGFVIIGVGATLLSLVGRGQRGARGEKDEGSAE